MPTPLAQQRPTGISAEQVARYFVKLANEEQKRIMNNGDAFFSSDDVECEGITHLKLQKLLYFAQAVSLAVKKAPLFDEKFEAWELGPVSRSVYKVFADYKRKPIPESEGRSEGLDAATEAFLKEVWKTFGKYTASQLVDMTHRHTPWKKAMQTKDRTIDEQEMTTFYTPLFVTSNAHTLSGR